MKFSNLEERIIRKAKELFPNSPQDQAYFIAIVEQESGFNPTAHNTRPGEGGGQGLFQFGPDLRRRYGITKDTPEEQQITAGSDYIRELHRKHGGDWPSIAGEYNLGDPDYRRMKRGETRPHISRFQKEYLPRLTARANARGAAQVVGEPTQNITLANPKSLSGPLVADRSLAEGDAQPPAKQAPSPDPVAGLQPNGMKSWRTMTPQDLEKMGFLMGLTLQR